MLLLFIAHVSMEKSYVQRVNTVYKQTPAAVKDCILHHHTIVPHHFITTIDIQSCILYLIRVNTVRAKRTQQPRIYEYTVCCFRPLLII